MTNKRIGLVHLCDNDPFIYEYLEKNGIEVVFHSMPGFAWDQNSIKNAQKFKNNIHFMEVVSYFLDLCSKSDTLQNKDYILNNIDRIHDVVANDAALIHLFERSAKTFQEKRIGTKIAESVELMIYMIDYLITANVKYVIYGVVPHHPWDHIFRKSCEFLSIECFYSMTLTYTGDRSFVLDSNLKPVDQDSGYSRENCLKFAKSICKSYLKNKSLIPLGLSMHDKSLIEIYGPKGQTKSENSDIDALFMNAKFNNNKDLGKISCYVLFALHFEPECTTNPMGGNYYEQKLAIMKIASCLPDNCGIILKEHPYFKKERENLSFYRDPAFFDFSNPIYPPVCYYDEASSLDSLLPNAFAAITLGGSILLDSFMNRVPVVIMGTSPATNNSRGIITDVDSNLNNNILQASEYLENNNIIDIVSELIQFTFPFVPYGNFSELIKPSERSTNSEGIAKSIHKLLES